MIWNWDSAFEGSPSGSDYGSVSGRILRRTKEAFLALLEAEHTVDLGADAVVSHAQGMASILGPATHSVITIETGGLVLDGGALYSYDGTDDLGFGDHSLLVNASPSDHPQYLARDDTRIKGAVSVRNVSDLDTALQEYIDTHFILSKGGHPEDGTPKHGKVEAADLTLGADDLDVVEQTGSHTFVLNDVNTGDATIAYNGGVGGVGETSTWSMPTAGTYTLGLILTTIDAISVGGDASLRYSLAAPLGSGGSSYQHNLLLYASAPLSYNEEQATMVAVGIQ